ncbi:TRAP transporter small permease [Nitratireductor pacificus]|uniref:TRAP transporter small permease protein n=1 Tax=Nitratireductor pacificus pht-3B TaxID=391937 RepID=K2MMX4_9HYPH|nr:TRAP transporter small permease subunit [Nitratireductor pacificus]EKF18602.1 tripartite ATP-independent periplasmic transporter DctQ [Nitratireductor pacificus pht-3B]
MRLLIDLMGRLNRVMSNLGVMIACIFLTTMTAAIILQVISRELRAPIGWTEEIALASMVWVSFLIGPWAYRHHQFTRIDVLVEAMPVRPRTFFNVLIHLLEAGLLIGAIYYSWLFFSGGNSLLPQTTRLIRTLAAPLIGAEAAGSIVVKNKYVYVILPIGFAGLLMISVEHILKSVRAFVSGEEDIRNFDLDGMARLPEGEAAARDADDAEGRG